MDSIASYVGDPSNPWLTGFEVVLIFYFAGFFVQTVYRMVMTAAKPEGIL